MLPLITAPIWSLPSADLVLTETLGEGSFSTVFKGKWKGKTVAVKKISMYKFTPKEVRLDSRLPKTRVSVYGRNSAPLNAMCVCTSVAAKDV